MPTVAEATIIPCEVVHTWASGVVVLLVPFCPNSVQSNAARKRQPTGTFPRISASVTLLGCAPRPLGLMADSKTLFLWKPLLSVAPSSPAARSQHLSRPSPLGLPPVEDGLHDVGRQAGERQQPADVRVRDALLLRKMGDLSHWPFAPRRSRMTGFVVPSVAN
jgi:hypothetical protein